MARREPTRLRDGIELIALLFVIAVVIVGLCSVDPAVLR